MTELSNGLRIFFNWHDRQAVRIATGIHEPTTQEAMHLVLRPGMNCIDVGAHIGLYTLLMALVVGQCGKVYAFEPFPDTYDLLVKNIGENHFEDIVFPFKVACHYEPGKGQIFSPCGDDLGPAFVPRRRDAVVTAGLAGIDVELARVDDLVPAQAEIGIVKMDIEGAEPFALRGMERIVMRDRPVIFTEFNPCCLRQMNESDPAEYLRWLRSYGYQLFEDRDFIQKTGHEFAWTGGDVTTNLVCVPD